MNFILRTIVQNEKDEPNNAPLNKIIGGCYSLATIFGKRTEVWQEEIKKHYPKISLKDAQRVVAMVISNECTLVYEGCYAYIMTDEGRTFEKIQTK